MKVRGGNPRIVIDGLVLFYDAQNPYSYPGSGTLVRDISGNGNDGTMTNASVGTTTSNIFTFTDTGDYVTFTDPLGQAATVQQWTVQCWVRHTIRNTDSNLLYYWNNRIALEWSTTTRPLNYLNGGDNDSYCYGNDNDFDNDTWTLGTFTFDRVNYDPGRVTTKKNLETTKLGVNVNSTDVPSGIQSTVRFGYDTVSKISNLMIYNRELTLTEITQNYNAQKTRYGL